MDEWMHLSSGEATYRQQEQRDMRRGPMPRSGTDSAWRVRTTLAAALVALAVRLDPAGALPRRESVQATPAA